MSLWNSFLAGFPAVDFSIDPVNMDKHYWYNSSCFVLGPEVYSS